MYRAVGKSMVASWSIYLFTAVSLTAQDVQSIASKLASTYEGLKSFSVTTKIQSRYLEDFLKYREQAGSPLSLRSPSYSGECKYFAQDGMFGCDNKNRWGDGTLMTDEMAAWDGTNWQFLNRQDPNGPSLEIARRRVGALESGAHLASPLEFGFPFLVAATAHTANGMLPADDHKWRITLDKIRDKALWQSLVKRLKGGVQMTDYQGQPCWKFDVDGGLARGDRATKIYYSVWLPVAAPVYPIRVETRSQDTKNLLADFEVTEFFDVANIESGAPLRFPKKFRTSEYTNDPRWLNKPYQVVDFEYTDCKFNPPLTNDNFKIDPSMAWRVELLDTKQTIYLKK